MKRIAGRWKQRTRYVAFFLRHSPLTVVGGVLVVLMLSLAVCAPVVAPHDPYKTAVRNRFQSPSWQHPAGTDALGRDVFSRILYGGRTALTIAFSAVSLALAVGVTLGVIAGFFGGIVDVVIMRFTDGFLAIPSFVLAMVAAVVLGPRLMNVVLAISLVSWTWNARIIRSAVLALRSSDFILIQRALGAGSFRTLIRHIIPNCTGPILIQASLQLGLAILTSAGLSFLGFGVQPPTADWGLMIAEGRAFLPRYWWLVTFPGIAIFLLVAGFLLIGDGLRDLLEREIR